VGDFRGINEKGLTESLAGRFETMPISHWNFSKEFKVKRNLPVGMQGIPLEQFFLTPPAEWFT
jgi:hypothetical protein